MTIEARDQLLREHLPLVATIAASVGRRLPRHIPRADLVADGLFGLVEAADRFDPDRGVPFGAFARQRVQYAILDGLRALDWTSPYVRRRQREGDPTAIPWQLVPFPAHEAVDPSDSVLTTLIRRDVQRRVAAAVAHLDARDQRVLHLVYTDEETPTQIAARLHISICRVFQLRRRALDRVREQLTRGA